MLGTLLLTLLAWYYVYQNVEKRERAWFDETEIMTEEAIDQRMDAYVDAMLDSRGLFYASSSVGQDEWRDYVTSSNLTSRYPGIQALGYIERVRLKQRDDHVERVREEGQASYELPPPLCADGRKAAFRSLRMIGSLIGYPLRGRLPI